MKKNKFLALVFVLAVCFASFFIVGAEADVQGSPVPVIGYSTKNDVSQPLRSITPLLPVSASVIHEIPMLPVTNKFSDIPAKEVVIDSVLQDWSGFPVMPSPVRNFEGVNNRNGVLPPDTNGDVGPNHYVQMTNLSFAIWNKNGTLLYGPANNNTLWTGFGGHCEATNDGDPIVLYDHLADRWMMSQFALPNYPNGPFYECIAISTTPNPTGSWYRYAFQVHATKMNDYPKFGLWPDAYYMSVNQFDSGGWAGGGAFAFDRAKMLAGLPASFIYFDLYTVDPNLGGQLPSHLNGSNLPPAGAPNYFIQFDDNAWGYSPDQLQIWSFHVDWTTPSNSTFTGPTSRTTASFDSNMCGYIRNCIPQPVTSIKVDALSDRLMNRLQYRNFGSYETLVLNHTVDADGTDHAGIRWYELRKTTGSWSIYQQGTFAPDSNHRWMGSIAMDIYGNIALGYSVSRSSTTFPSIRYTGRLSSDTLGTLPQGEATLIAGGGSQTHSASRWGDYSSMSVDPTDDCTFWYTQEYYQTTSSAGWQTRIGSFQFPSCGGGGGGTFSISGRVTTGGGGGVGGSSPLAGVTMTLGGAGSGTTSTNSFGNYTFTGLSNGSYTVTPGKAGYTFTPTTRNVNISGANVTGQNFTGTYTGAPTYSISGNVKSGGNPLSGVTISLTGNASKTTTTDSSGHYIFTGITDGNYTLTPSKSGYTFNPVNSTFSVSGANVILLDFVGTSAPVTYSISGTVKTPSGGSPGKPIPNVTLTLSGNASGVTVTDTLGKYSFTGLSNGNYTLTPSKTGMTFTPTNRAVTVNGANVTGRDFVGN